MTGQELDWLLLLLGAVSLDIPPTYLFRTFEDVALEGIGGAVSGNVREDLKVLGVVGHVEDAVDGVEHDEQLRLVPHLALLLLFLPLEDNFDPIHRDRNIHWTFFDTAGLELVLEGTGIDEEGRNQPGHGAWRQRSRYEFLDEVSPYFQHTVISIFLIFKEPLEVLHMVCFGVISVVGRLSKFDHSSTTLSSSPPACVQRPSLSDHSSSPPGTVLS